MVISCQNYVNTLRRKKEVALLLLPEDKKGMDNLHLFILDKHILKCSFLSSFF